MWLQGLPEMPVQKLNLENIIISAKAGVTCIEADDLRFRNVKIMSEKSPVFALYNSRNFVMEDITFPDSNEVFMKLDGGRTQAIHLKGIDKSQIDKKIQLGRNVKPDAIIVE
jgi:DNA sulfur modification protein DndE